VAPCHAEETRLWAGSHHGRAMEVANEQSVLGDFNGASFTYGGITSRFYRRDGKFLVYADGPDGAMQEYEVTYTFGVAPLQHYLIAMPGGRYQALGVAWDARPAAAGGQRWFHLYPFGATLPIDGPPRGCRRRRASTPRLPPKAPTTSEAAEASPSEATASEPATTEATTAEAVEAVEAAVPPAQSAEAGAVAAEAAP
jgi:hypothetical protein